jgi:2,4-dienoyl-CoA reductase-like NADH-dependent reductase (Old Yellow Enzyme family)
MSNLFDPIDINGMLVPNRTVRSATNDRVAEISGHVNPSFIAVYEALAAGGVGLIITGHAYVTWNGKASDTMLGVHQDDLVPGLKQLVDTIHGYDSKIVLQLNHAGRQTGSAVIGETPIAPSAVKYPATGETPREMSDTEIEEMILAYGAAARRAQTAGFDGVQIHAAHGYLASQFISPYTNKRKDRWGGSLENRMRFPLEIYRCVRKVVGEGYPVLVKLNSEDFLDGGLTIQDSTEIAGALDREGIDAVEISGGMAESVVGAIRADIYKETDEAYFLPNGKSFQQAIDVPLILVGGLRTPTLMDHLLKTGDADMISLCRPLIREPDLVNKWKNGDLKKADCISCNGCQKYKDEPVRCIIADP